MPDEPSDALSTFRTWLLRRVATAVEAGEVSAALLTELAAEFAGAHELPQAEGHQRAVTDIAAGVALPEDTVGGQLAALEAQPEAIRLAFLQQIAEVWLEGHRSAYREDRDGRGPREGRAE